jgi:predicted patatin/cPLA2 family phospholipase
MIGLELAGLHDVFDVVVGVSAGAANAAYLLSKQTIPGTSIYYEDLTDKRFINPFRMRKVVDIDYVEWVFRNHKVLDLEAIRQSRSEFYTVATSTNGDAHFINTKTVDTVMALKASMAMPVLYNKPVEIGGDFYLDGVASACIPVEETIRKFQPTDLLIVMNTPLEKYPEKISLAERFATRLALRRFSRELRDGFLKRDVFHNQTIDILNNGAGCNVAVICPDFMISKHTQNKKLLREVAVCGARRVWDVFGSGELKASEILL